MKISAPLAVTPIGDADLPEVIALWERCGSTRPWNDPAADIALACRGDNATVLLGRADGVLVASVMVGHDGHRGWVYYVTTDPGHRNKGYGRAIMAAAEHWLRDRRLEKMQLMVRPDNPQVQAFYEAIGFGEQKRIVYAKWLDGRPLTP